MAVNDGQSRTVGLGKDFSGKETDFLIGPTGKMLVTHRVTKAPNTIIG